MGFYHALPQGTLSYALL